MKRHSLVSYLKSSLVFLFHSLVVAVPLFYLSKSVYPYIFPKHALFQIIAEAILGIWVALAVLEPAYRPKRSVLLYSVLGFGGILLLTGFLGEDFYRSFWSVQERLTGIIFFLHLIAVYVAARSSFSLLPWRRLAIASLGTAGLISIMGLIQLWNPNLLLVEPIYSRPGATFGNPTFLAGYLTFHLFIGLYGIVTALLERKGKSARERRGGTELWVLSGLVFLYGIMLLNTQTRGDLLGFAIGVLSIFAWYAFSNSQRQHLPIGKAIWYRWVLGIIVVSAGIFWFTRTATLWRHVPGLSRFSEVSSEGLSSQPRVIALRAGWEGIKEKPILGWGWENFNIVFNKYYDPAVLSSGYEETRFDKPHNIYVEYAVTGGLLLFFAFIGLIGTWGYEVARLNEKTLQPFLYGAMIAYLIRSFFVFDTIGPAVMFYLMIAFADGLYLAQSSSVSLVQTSKQPKAGEGLSVLAYVILAVTVIPIYVLNIGIIRAARLQYQGFNRFANNHIQSGIDAFKQAAALWTPYRLNFKQDYATSLVSRYFSNPEAVPVSEVVAAAGLMEEVVAEHPNDAYNHYILVDFYNQISDISPGLYLQKASDHAERALELSPDRQEVYFSLAKTKSLEGDNLAALALLQKAIDLNPSVADAHFYYGLIVSLEGDKERAYFELKEAIRLGRKWKTHHEARTVANFFADFGKYDDAIELYKISLEMKDELETHIKLGVAYFFQGDRNAARAELGTALRGMTEIDSASVQDLLPILRELGLVQ